MFENKMNETFFNELSDLTNYIEIEGVKTRYIDVGSGDTVILIHGLGGSIETWAPNIPSLSSHFRVIALDLLGHGFTFAHPFPERYKLHSLTKFLLNFIDTLRLDSFNLIGRSLGGIIAGEIALIRKKHVKKLILVSSAGLMPLSIVQLIKILLKRVKKICSRNLHLEPSLEEIKRNLAKNIFYNQKLIPEWLVELEYKNVKDPYKRFVINLIKDELERQSNSLLKDLKSISVPTMIIWGKYDKIFPYTLAVGAYKKLKTCRLLILEDCGHIPSIEKSNEFNNAVIDFLRS